MTKTSKTKTSQGLAAAAAKLVYEDKIPVYIVASSAVLREMFKIFYDITLSRHPIGNTMVTDHHLALQNSKSKVSNRDKAQLLCISFDKWTSADWSKFVRVYLYCGDKLCQGIIRYKGVCGVEDICTLMRNHLKLFDLMLSDISLSITPTRFRRAKCSRNF